MLDYVRNITGVKQLRYFGNSQGTTTFLVLNSMKPEYNTIFKSAHLLAPVGFLSNANNKFLRLARSLVGRSNLVKNIVGTAEFRPSKELMAVVGNVLCTDFSDNQVLCENLYFVVAGFTNETVNNTIITDLMASNPAGSSANQILHFIQEFISGHFRQFDHGVLKNLEAYGSPSPQDYPLENINVPIFFYYSLADNFASKKDVIKLGKKLKTLMGKFENPIENFDHLAHMYSENLAEKVHKFVMKDVQSIV